MKEAGAMQVVGAAGRCWEKSWAACRVFQHPDADGRSAGSAADASRTCGCSVWLKSRVSSFRKSEMRRSSSRSTLESQRVGLSQSEEERSKEELRPEEGPSGIYITNILLIISNKVIYTLHWDWKL